MTSDNDGKQDFAPGLGNIPPAAHDDHGPVRRRRWPWIVAIVVLGLVGLVAAGPSLLSTAWLNGKVQSYLDDNLQDGTSVRFGKLDISWSTGIRLTDLELRRSASDTEPLVRAPLVEFDADVWPLLVRRLDVRKFVFHDPVVRIERTREGTLNTEDVVKTRKKRKKRKDGGEDEAVVLPEIDVPVEVHGLKLIIVADDGREVERGGIEFSGNLTTRKGPTTFDLHVPVGEGAMDVAGVMTLFDEEGVLLPTESLGVETVVRLDALDAAANRDLLTLFLAEAPTAGVLDGQATVESVGRDATGSIELTVRGLAMDDASRPAGEQEDLRISGAFERKGDRITIRDGLIRAPGLEGRIALTGTLAALDGEATLRADLARSAAALASMGIEVPAGVAGVVDGTLTFRPEPARGDGVMTITGLRAPAAVEGGEPLAIDTVTASVALTHSASEITIRGASLEIPNELKCDVEGSVATDGALDMGITVAGRVPEIVRRGKAMGLVPQGVAIAGSLDGIFSVARSPGSDGFALSIERVALRDEGVRIDASGDIADNGAVDLRMSGEGNLQNLLAAGGADERLSSLKGTFAFAAAAHGPAASLSAELESLRIDGDLLLAATGRMRGDGRLEGALTVDGRIPDAVALARGLGLVEGEIPLDGRIHGDVKLAGSRERPEVPSAQLTVDDGPVRVDVAGSISELGTLEATLTSSAQLDTLLAIAHARGAMSRPHTTGGELRVAGVLAGTRERPELPELKVAIDGPLNARAEGSLDAEHTAHVRSTISGALQPLAQLFAAVTGEESQPVSGTYDGDISLDGALDALQVRVTKLLVRSEGVTLDANAALRPGGTAETTLAMRGPLEGVFTIAHAFGQLTDVGGTGKADVALDLKLAGGDDERVVRGSLTGTIHELAMLRADTPGVLWKEDRVEFAVPSFKHALGAAAKSGETQRPMALELDTASGVSVRARVSAGDEGPIDLEADISGPVQPMLDASAVFTGGGADTKIRGSIATKEPLRFHGDVSAGRELAAGWTGGTVIELTDVVAPYVEISRGTLTAAIADGRVQVEPIDVAINGGTATGEATIGLLGKKPEHVLTLHAKQVRIDADLAPFLARAMPILAVGDAGDAGGVAGIDMDLTAKGLDGDRLRNTVSGSGVMHLEGVYAESRNWIGKLLEMAGAGARLEVLSADVPFTVKRGKVTTENLDMTGSGMDLRLGGTVGLDGTIDYAFGVKPKNGGADLGRFEKLFDADGYLPLRLEGDIASPDMKFPSLGDTIKSGLGGLLDDVLGKDEDKEDAEKKKEEEERRKRRRERRKRKKEQEQGGTETPPDDGADEPE